MLTRDNKGRFMKGNTGYWLGRERDLKTIKKIVQTCKTKNLYKPNKGSFKKGYIMKRRKLTDKEKKNISITTKLGMILISDYKKEEMRIKSSIAAKRRVIEGKCKIGQPGIRNSIATEFKKGNNPFIPLKQSSIELKIQGFLRLLGIEYYDHWYINQIKSRYQSDIFIPLQPLINQKTVIECDGDYWHGNPNIFNNLTSKQIMQKEKDNIRTKELIEKGFNVIRLWESEIRKLTLEDFKVKLNPMLIEVGS